MTIKNICKKVFKGCKYRFHQIMTKTNSFSGKGSTNQASSGFYSSSQTTEPPCWQSRPEK